MARENSHLAISGTSHDVTSSLDQLRISSGGTKARKQEPVKSWEDETSDTETKSDGQTMPDKPCTSDVPQAPPATRFVSGRQREQIAARVSMPDFDFVHGAFDTSSVDSTPTTNTRGEDKRPEKSTAVASRLIAAAIGQKAPRRTEEQRKYDQAMKIQEKKKRDQAREAENKRKLEAEQAKKAIWDD